MSKQTITLRTTVDAVEAVPVVLGFQPADSLVLLMISDTAPTARFDMPHNREALTELVEAFGHAKRHFRNAAGFIICYTDDSTWALRAAGAITDLLPDVGWIEALRVNEGAIYSVEDTEGLDPIPVRDERIVTAHVPVMPESDRASLDQKFRDAVPTEDYLNERAKVSITSLSYLGWWISDRLAEVTDRFTTHDLAWLAAACQEADLRDIVLVNLNENHGPAFMDAAQRCERDNAEFLAVCALAAYLNGNGAVAWAIHDSHAAVGETPLGKLLDGFLRAAVPPKEIIDMLRLAAES